MSAASVPSVPSDSGAEKPSRSESIPSSSPLPRTALVVTMSGTEKGSAIWLRSLFFLRRKGAGKGWMRLIGKVYLMHCLGAGKAWRIKGGSGRPCYRPVLLPRWIAYLELLESSSRKKCPRWSVRGIRGRSMRLIWVAFLKPPDEPGAPSVGAMAVGSISSSVPETDLSLTSRLFCTLLTRGVSCVRGE